MVIQEEMIKQKNNPKKSVVVPNLDELAIFADRFIKSLSEIQEGGVSDEGVKQKQNPSSGGYAAATVVGLSGDLGAGKTAFSQQVAKILGIESVVNSPTFVIQKNYETKHPVFRHFAHIDAYRLESGEEMEKLKFKELVRSPETLIFIEWPEKIAEILPKNTIMLSFKTIDENTRKISY